MQSPINTVGVYCASSSAVDSAFIRAANRLGQILAAEQITCVNGGGSTGLMGALSDGVMAHGGRVVGVIPRFMCENGWLHPHLTESEIVETMHQRKERMAEMSDALVALPGGIGTMEELLEILTWKQLGLCVAPIVIVNINGFYEPLLAMLQRAIDGRFMREQHRAMWQTVSSVEEVLPAIDSAPHWDPSYVKIAAI